MFKGRTPRRKLEHLESVHSNICGLIMLASKVRNKHIITFIIDYHSKTYVHLMKEKNEVFSKFEELKILVENKRGSYIKKLRID